MLRNRNTRPTNKLVKKSIANLGKKKMPANSKQRSNLGRKNLQTRSQLIQFQAKDVHHHFERHFASRTQLMYSSFGIHCYLPPHLSSIQIKQNVFKAQPKRATIRPSSAKKYEYDTIYNTYEAKYQKSPKVSRQWSGVKSKIKYLIDQDRLTYNHFHSVKQIRQRQKHPDDDLSQESSAYCYQE